MNFQNTSISLIIGFFIAFSSQSQTNDLNLGENKVENAAFSLSYFKLKMDSLQAGKIKKVNILQIGDSHIQPDNFSGEIRRQLQKQYGNGGRGLIFPYNLAKTNGPKDYTASSNTTWSNSWITHFKQKFKIGFPGIGMQSETDAGTIDFNMTKDSIKSPYIKAFVVYSMEPSSKGTITLNNQVTKNNSGLLFDTICINLKKEQTTLKVEFKDTKLTFHAVYFENQNPGLVYSSVGVAGAKYTNFLANEFFSKQLPIFNSDLIIISMGTNEAYDSRYDSLSFAITVDSMLTTIQKVNPNASILLTLPSENYRVKSGQPTENLNTASVSRILRNQAIKHNCAIWDLYAVMGGKGSMLKWRAAGLVNKDHIHYLRKGYNLQGHLLSDALIQFLEVR